MFKKIATLGGVGLAGIALIGAGALATFTQDTNSNQVINAGTMKVVLSADGASGNGTPTITLPPVGPTGSTFTAGPNLVTINNTGNIPATEISLKVSDTNSGSNADLALKAQTYACLYSAGYIIFNEPLTVAESYLAFAVGNTQVPPPDSYTLVLYAGNGSGAYAGCGTTSTSVSGGAFQPGGATYTGSLPTAGVNPTAASLDNNAQGGALNVKVTISYQG